MPAEFRDGQAAANKTVRLGRAAWFNGSLLENKGLNNFRYINQTGWATGGEWIFHEDIERWCLPNGAFSGKSASDLVHEQLFADLIEAAEGADRAFEKMSAGVA